MKMMVEKLIEINNKKISRNNLICLETLKKPTKLNNSQAKEKSFTKMRNT